MFYYFFLQYKKSLVENFTTNALPRFESIIDRIFSFEEIEAAHKIMEDNKNTGKIILKIREEPKEEL